MKKTTLEELNEMLHNNAVVRFSFRKKDESTRVTTGTLNEFLIPTKHLPKEDEGKKNLGTNLKFFDVYKQGWRSLVYDCSTLEIDEHYDSQGWEELVSVMKIKRKDDKNQG